MTRPKIDPRLSRSRGFVEPEPQRGPATRVFSQLYLLLRVATAGIFTFAFAFAAALVWFGFTMPGGSTDTVSKTDVIVVLTGGEKRLKAGVDLLRQNMAPRLYVSGVNPKIEKPDLLKLAGSPPEDIAARIEIDIRAANTRGNAKESALWFNSRNLRSLRLVTGNYHMRRSLLQFGRALPRARIIPHAVVPQGLEPQRWWTNLIGIRTVAEEFVKYGAALVGYVWE